MITIINYGVGNINAIIRAYKTIGIDTKIANTVKDLEQNVTKIILPGVGAFDHAMRMLNLSGMKDKLNQLVQIDKIPVLGICVGMQIMANCSEEGDLPGLGWINGYVKKIEPTELNEQVPQMGWNNIEIVQQNQLINGFSEEDYFYFIHSYYFKCNNKSNQVAITNYTDIDFDTIISNENIYGVQFHPEKSHDSGLKLLQNFARLC